MSCIMQSFSAVFLKIKTLFLFLFPQLFNSSSINLVILLWPPYSCFLPVTLLCKIIFLSRRRLQVWRALRLIVDTGLHYVGMSREQALKYFSDYAWDDTDLAKKEVRG